MAFLDSLKSFDKSKLKHTDTKVTTTEGELLLEKRDSSGSVTMEKISPTYGFVPSFVEDLQVGEVLPGQLILGSQDVAHDLPTLEMYKVTHILNLASYVANKFPDKLTYKDIKINDLPEVPIFPIFNRAFEFIEEGIKSGCVLVHCNAGVSRCASVVIGYLMKTRRMTYKDAFDLVKEKRPAICPNEGFRTQLKTYEKMLESERQQVNS